MNKKKQSIYVAYHKSSPLIVSRSIIPIHVGRAISSSPLDDMIGDDTGEAISEKNAKYCELTAMYWAWKNDHESDMIGLMHYRRLLDLPKWNSNAKPEVFLEAFPVEKFTTQAEEWIKNNRHVELVIPKPHTPPISVRENYAAAHNSADLKVMEKYIIQKYPDYEVHLQNVLSGNKIYLANMFIANRSIFEKYCAFLFDILDYVDGADVFRGYYSTYQKRYLGFLSERIFTVFIEKYLADHPDTEVRYVNILNISKANCVPYSLDKRLNKPESVNIAFSTDLTYLPHAAAMLMSAIGHFSLSRSYNIFMLYSKIESDRISTLQHMVSPFSNVHLHAINIGDPFKDSYRPTDKYPPSATYNRFLLFSLLPSINRIIYVDCDMIVRGDLAIIFDIEMGDSKIAAVPDFIMTRSLTNKVRIQHQEISDLYTYQRETLQLTDQQIYNYFNAGLIVFNFAVMNVATTGSDLVDLANRERFAFQDQDLLNMYFKDSYLRLPATYNVFNSDEAAYTHVPAENQAEALAARRNPFIIHFAASHNKPWRFKGALFASLYWESLLKTPFFAEVMVSSMHLEERLNNNSKPNDKLLVKNDRLLVKIGKNLSNRYPSLRPGLYRIYVSFFRRHEK